MFVCGGWQLIVTTLLARARHKLSFFPLLQPSQWKSLRQELLRYLEYFLMAVTNTCPMSAPPNRTAAMWEDFITCLKDQDLLSSAVLETQSCYLLTKTAVSRPLFLILDDNFYYQSMRYEVYQLARKCNSNIFFLTHRHLFAYQNHHHS